MTVGPKTQKQFLGGILRLSKQTATLYNVSSHSYDTTKITKGPSPTSTNSNFSSLSSSSSSSSSPPTNDNDRPFKILGLQQVAIGSLDKSSLLNLWTNILGVPKIGTFQSKQENVYEDILLLGPPLQKENSAFSIEIDLMSPLDPDKKPMVHSPSLNHIGLWVNDLPAAVKWMEENGVRFASGGIRKGASGHDITFIHPKGNEDSPIGGAGVLIELVQAPPDIIEVFDCGNDGK